MAKAAARVGGGTRGVLRPARAFPGVTRNRPARIGEQVVDILAAAGLAPAAPVGLVDALGGVEAGEEVAWT